MADSKIDKQNSCDGKIGYDTRAAASGAAAGLNEKGGSKMGAYKCDHCRKYHIGHTMKRKTSKASRPKKRDKKKIDTNEFKATANIRTGFCFIKQSN